MIFQVTVENGNHQIADNIDDLSSGDQADSIEFRSDTTADNMEGEEKINEERKSKIPMSRLKQVAERVKRERQAQREKAKPRRSSIPKLKDPKKIKRDTSLNIEPQVDDEFEKLYEEIVEDKPVEIEVKLPVVSIDDPEKIETKFEELIHAYDEEETVVEEIVDQLVEDEKVVDELVGEEKVVNEVVGEEKVVDELLTEEKVVDESVGEDKIVKQAVEEVRPSISKVSKIPALSKKEDSPSMRALMERVKEVSTAEAELKDGGFKVTSSNIRIKRYSRGNSELSRDEQRIDSIEEIEDDTVFDTDNAQSTDKDGDVSKGDKKATKPRSIRKKSELLEQQRQAKLREELRRKQKQLRNGIEDPVVVDKVGDNIDDLNAVLMKTERIVRNISREINEDKKSIINTETVTTEEQNDGGVRTITTTTTETFVVDSPVVHEKIIRNISKENTGTIEVITEEKPKKAESSIPVKTERFTRGISREMGNFRQSIHREVSQSKEDLNATDNKVDNKPVVKKETMRVEQIEKEGIKIGIPVFTKISRSYSKGKIQNVEMSRTIEWKPADVVTNKGFNRSTSENITKNELKDAKRDFKAPVSETNDNNNINGDTTRDRVIENNIKDTVKAQAKTKSIRKVTEFKTEEQVTNEERTTFTLSRSVDLSLDNDFKTARAIGTQMSVDGQNIDRDYKIGKDASTRISVINEKLVPKDLKPSREIGTQMSVDISKTHEENNKVPPVLGKKETADSNLPVKEKDSDITQVTTLKGNVSRLKDKMGKDKEIGSKKEKEEEFPKKKSVLSKIAMFEVSAATFHYYIASFLCISLTFKY
uniref:SFRICE_025237 n=1 Tax=Spodoptera frugiperda TaxID=7108 RepID=A0A2H1VWY6_SPOFR